MNHNNIYNILGKLNAVQAKDQPKPADIKKQTPKTQLQENMEQVLSRKLISEKKAKPDYIDLDKDGNKKEPMKKAAKDVSDEIELKGLVASVDTTAHTFLIGAQLIDYSSATLEGMTAPSNGMSNCCHQILMSSNRMPF